METLKHITKAFHVHNRLLPFISPKPCLLDFLAPLSLRILWLKFLGTTGQVPEMQYLNLQ